MVVEISPLWHVHTWKKCAKKHIWESLPFENYLMKLAQHKNEWICEYAISVITSRLILHTLSSNYPLWRGGANVDLLLGIRGLATIFLTRALMDCRRFFCLDIVDDFDFYLLIYLKVYKKIICNYIALLWVIFTFLIFL